MKKEKTKLTARETKLMDELKVDNIHALPAIKTIIVNSGVGKQRDDKVFIEAVKKDLARITGQKAQERTAKKAVAGFNVRQGNLVGLRVTLRGQRMKDFLDKFVRVTMPRIRDFRGLLTKSLDRDGNLNVGLQEQLAFPEIDAEKTDVTFGVQVTLVTTAKNQDEAMALFKSHGFVFREETADDLT
jgi:large subunit ribosomal protein L5